MIGTSSGKTIMATNKVLGRSTAGTGAIEEISIGSNLTLSGGTLSASGGVTGVAASATDILSVSGSDIAADDPGADRLVFWDDSDNKLTYLTAGSGLTITGTTIAASGGIGGSTGSVDNAILRADGTGGATLQTSGLVAEDAIVSFTGITGDAGTDVITATGSAFANGQPVRFTALTGGSGLNTTTNYFVREVSGATFKVETSIGGGAINFTTNITAGTLLTGHSVSTNVTLSENTTATNSDLVLTPKGTGALIVGPKPDGTAVGGNARGAQAIDLQTKRAAATQVASGLNSVTLGVNCTATSAGNTSPATYSVAIGISSQATGNQSMALGQSCIASGIQSYALGEQNQATSTGSSSIGGSSNVAQIANHAAVFGGTSNNSYGANCGIFSGSSNQASASHAAVFSGASSHSSNTHSISFGPNVLSDRRNMFAHGGGQFAAQGDAQRARFVLRCKTTTNAAVEMALDGSTTYLTIPSGKVMFMNIKVVGTKSDGSAVATYERQYAVKNVAGTSSEVYAPITIGTDNAAGTTIEVATVDAGDYVRIRPTGIASETWRWVASVDAVEVTYGT